MTKIKMINQSIDDNDGDVESDDESAAAVDTVTVDENCAWLMVAVVTFMIMIYSW